MTKPSIDKICARMKELHEYFEGDFYLSFHLIQLYALTKKLIEYLERGVEPTDFQWCLEEKYESLEDYTIC